MTLKRFGRKPKAKDNTGRSTEVTSLMISRELKDRLADLKLAYEGTFDETVTYDQMLRRWADHVGRIDPKVVDFLNEMREIRNKEKKRLASGLGLTVEQLEENERSFDPTDGKVWELKYSFEKDGEEIDAVPGDLTPFYAKYKGRNTGMAAMLKDGWTLQNEIGCELTPEQAEVISNKIKEHGK